MTNLDTHAWVWLVAAGWVLRIVWERRVALVDWLAGLLGDDEPAVRVRAPQHPSVRVLRGPYDYERDA